MMVGEQEIGEYESAFFIADRYRPVTVSREPVRCDTESVRFSCYIGIILGESDGSDVSPI